MTDQEQSVLYWLSGVDDAMTTAEILFKGKVYHHALFYCQLAVEKQLKALIVKNLDRSAPMIHDLVELAKIAQLSFSTTRSSQLHDITDFNLAARYDNGPITLKQKANRRYFLKWYKITQEILRWLAKH